MKFTLLSFLRKEKKGVGCTWGVTTVGRVGAKVSPNREIVDKKGSEVGKR